MILTQQLIEAGHYLCQLIMPIKRLNKSAEKAIWLSGWAICMAVEIKRVFGIWLRLLHNTAKRWQLCNA